MKDDGYQTFVGIMVVLAFGGFLWLVTAATKDGERTRRAEAEHKAIYGR